MTIKVPMYTQTSNTFFPNSPEAFSAPNVYVKGDYKKIKNDVHTHKYNQLINIDRTPELKYISLKDIVPMETQRHADVKWALAKLKALGGLDMLAFGVVYIARCNSVNYAYDGLGRLTIAGLVDNPSLNDNIPCLVYNMSQEEMAKYFSYTQSVGKRILSKESFFVCNAKYNDPATLNVIKMLELTELFIKGDTESPVGSNSPARLEILVRPFLEVLRYLKIDIENGDIPDNDHTTSCVKVIKEAHDIIYRAWNNTAAKSRHGVCHTAEQDVFWALINLIKMIPEIADRKSKIYSHFVQYIDWVAHAYSQKNYRKILRKELGDVNTQDSRKAIPALGHQMIKQFIGSWSNLGKYDRQRLNERVQYVYGKNVTTMATLEDFIENDDIDDIDDDTEE